MRDPLWKRILKVLELSPMTTEQLSLCLNVSRTMVWNQIHFLRISNAVVIVGKVKKERRPHILYGLKK